MNSPSRYSASLRSQPDSSAQSFAGFERRLTFEPGYDNLPKGGIAAMKLRWVLHGPKGSVQWLIGTDWFQASARNHLSTFPPLPHDLKRRPEGWDLGCHADEPQYEGQSDGECDLRPGGRCFYDGSGLNADLLIEGFLIEGEPYVWRALAAFYEHVFEGADWPFPLPPENSASICAEGVAPMATPGGPNPPLTDRQHFDGKEG